MPGMQWLGNCRRSAMQCKCLSIMAFQTIPKENPMTSAQFDPNLTVPPEVAAAAVLLGRWATENGLEWWQVGGVCSRRYAFRLESLSKALADLGFMKNTNWIYPAQFYD